MAGTVETGDRRGNVRADGRDPEAYLRNVIGSIADHAINRIADLLRWNVAAPASIRAAA